MDKPQFIRNLKALIGTRDFCRSLLSTLSALRARLSEQHVIDAETARFLDNLDKEIRSTEDMALLNFRCGHFPPDVALHFIDSTTRDRQLLVFECSGKCYEIQGGYDIDDTLRDALDQIEGILDYEAQSAKPAVPSN
jgi:hypothetical protein